MIVYEIQFSASKFVRLYDTNYERIAKLYDHAKIVIKRV